MNLSDFHHRISGKQQGPWLIFLHGLLGSLANWRRITPSFEDRYRILTFDQRGHGRSLKPKDGYAPEDFAGDLNFLMDQLNIADAYLVGHSMGGRNAQCFANLYPSRVRKLVIEDIGPGDNVAAGKGLIEKLKAVPVPFSSKLKAKEFLYNHFSDPKLGPFLYMNINDKGDWEFDINTVIEVVEKGRGAPRWSEIDKLKVPTLILRGDSSQELPQNEYENILKRNKMIRGVVVENAGHWIHFDQPDKFISIVDDFLEGRL